MLDKILEKIKTLYKTGDYTFSFYNNRLYVDVVIMSSDIKELQEACGRDIEIDDRFYLISTTPDLVFQQLERHTQIGVYKTDLSYMLCEKY